MKQVRMLFSQAELEAIAGALGHTEVGLTNGEIAFLFEGAKLADPGPMTKRHRIYNAFAESQNRKQNRTNILQFVRLAMDPARYVREPHRFEPMRESLNQALAFAGLAVDAAGVLAQADRATTLSQAQRRANELRADLEGRGVHPDVLQFCRAELLSEDYFHAVQEAAKSVAAKLQAMTGVRDDGSALVEKTLAGDPPLVAINALESPSEKSEQSGFANLVRGTFGMFRNPTAHAPRVSWPMGKRDAEDLLTIVSMIHRRLDGSRASRRT